MSDKVDTLPGEATALFRVDQILKTDSVQQFMDTFFGQDTLARDRFVQIAQNIGYTLFVDGMQRPGLPPDGEARVDVQGKVLVREAEMFSMGVASTLEEFDL